MLYQLNVHEQDKLLQQVSLSLSEVKGVLNQSRPSTSGSHSQQQTTDQDQPELFHPTPIEQEAIFQGHHGHGKLQEWIADKNLTKVKAVRVSLL